MEANINDIKKRVQDMEELYKFIQEIANESDDMLCEVYGTSNLRHIIQGNSLKELYEKWLLYKKSR